MSYNINVGETKTISIEYLDQHDNLIVPQPTPDSMPEWSQLAASVQSLVPAPDGMVATVLGLASGNDTVRLDVIVQSRSFIARLDAVVSAVSEPQVLSSVRLVAS